MSELDEFARATVAPTLHPGEQLLSIGWMAPGNANWRNDATRYFAVGTTHRLVVITSSQGFLHGTPKAQNEGVAGYALAQLGGAANRPFAAMTESLVLQHPGGTASYAIPSPSILGAKSVEGHPVFATTYVPWLCRHVASGTFRTPEGTAAAAAEWQNPAFLAQANERYQISTGRSTQSTRGPKWPWLLALCSIVLIPLGLAFKDDASKSIGYAERAIEFTKKTAAEQGDALQFDPEEHLAEEQRKIDKAKSKQTQGTLLLVGGGVGVVGFSILGIVLGVKRRSAARAAAASGAALPG